MLLLPVVLECDVSCIRPKHQAICQLESHNNLGVLSVHCLWALIICSQTGEYVHAHMHTQGHTQAHAHACTLQCRNTCSAGCGNSATPSWQRAEECMGRQPGKREKGAGGPPPPYESTKSRESGQGGALPSGSQEQVDG